MKFSSLVDLIHRVNQRALEQFSERHRKDVTPRQVAVLRAIAESKGGSQTAIVDATGIDRSTTAEIVKRLVSRGLVKRRRSRADARAYSVTITPEGEQVLAAAEPVLAEIESALLGELPDHDRDCFVASLQRLATAQVGRLS
jgi:MarR family transcriptional regulator, temperature-dependent positive regulator of motility